MTKTTEEKTVYTRIGETKLEEKVLIGGASSGKFMLRCYDFNQVSPSVEVTIVTNGETFPTISKTLQEVDRDKLEKAFNAYTAQGGKSMPLEQLTSSEQRYLGPKKTPPQPKRWR